MLLPAPRTPGVPLQLVTSLTPTAVDLPAGTPDIRTSTGNSIRVTSEDIEGMTYVAIEYGDDVHELIDFDEANARNLIDALSNLLNGPDVNLPGGMTG